jgi:hypothetical protein
LRNTQIGDDSLAYLGGLQQLVELHLDNTQVTDAGLVHLRRCLHLQVLSLENTQVSVAGLSQLKGLVGLKDLQALGLDLAVDELSDIDALQQKWQYTTRSRVTSNPLLLGEILRAWKERQERLISFDIQSVGVQTERNTSFNVVQECVVDSQGHVRYSYSASTPIRTSFVTAFDGRTTKSLTTDPAGDYPFATERPGSTDWSRDRTVYPITVALRPFADLFGEADLVVTDDEELINGCNCVVMYHPDGKVWVDASRDYVPLRYSFIRRGLTLFQIDISFQKDDKVGWVPAAWTYVNFGRDGNVTMGTEITISECSFNEAIAWDVFQIAYPSNTRVTDHVTGTRYIVSTNGTRQVLGRIPP